MQKPIADVFTWPAEEPKLIGGRCTGCAAVTFPTQSRCPRCSTPTMEDIELPTEGTLVSWTTQGFPPAVDYMEDPTGTSFVPFGVGLVQLGDVVRVESRLTENDPEKLDFGIPVKLEIIPFFTNREGDEIVTFAFTPTSAPAGGK